MWCVQSDLPKHCMVFWQTSNQSLTFLAQMSLMRRASWWVWQKPVLASNKPKAPNLHVIIGYLPFRYINRRASSYQATLRQQGAQSKKKREKTYPSQLVMQNSHWSWNLQMVMPLLASAAAIWGCFSFQNHFNSATFIKCWLIIWNSNCLTEKMERTSHQVN